MDAKQGVNKLIWCESHIAHLQMMAQTFGENVSIGNAIAQLKGIQTEVSNQLKK